MFLDIWIFVFYFHIVSTPRTPFPKLITDSTDVIELGLIPTNGYNYYRLCLTQVFYC